MRQSSSRGGEYQGNAFGGFRRSTILGCYDNRGEWTAVVVAALVAVAGVVTEVRKRKTKSRGPTMGYILHTPVRDASLCCKSVTCNVNTLCIGHSSLRLSFATNPVRTLYARNLSPPDGKSIPPHPDHAS